MKTTFTRYVPGMKWEFWRYNDESDLIWVATLACEGNFILTLIKMAKKILFYYCNGGQDCCSGGKWDWARELICIQENLAKSSLGHKESYKIFNMGVKCISQLIYLSIQYKDAPWIGRKKNEREQVETSKVFRHRIVKSIFSICLLM